MRETVFMALSNAQLTQLLLYFVSFIISYWVMLGLDFEKIMRRNKNLQVQILAVLLAMALSYLVVGFIYGLQVI